MTDKFANLPPKIVQLLTVMFSPSSADGERVAAMRALDRYLKSVGADGHELVARIATPPLGDEEMQRVFDAGREQERNAMAEQRQRAVAAVASFGSGDDPDGHNGCSWREIVGHCLLNQKRIRNDWEANVFIPGVAARLANPSYEVSVKEAPILRRIFQRWFNGKIT